MSHSTNEFVEALNKKLDEAAAAGAGTADLDDAMGQTWQKRRAAAAEFYKGTVNVLQHLTRARHMCYRRQFIYESCLKWQGVEAGAPGGECAEARLMFQACNAELYVVWLQRAALLHHRAWAAARTRAHAHAHTRSPHAVPVWHRLRKVKGECPKQLKVIVDCLNANKQDATKCRDEMTPFDRCTEDYMPGAYGTFF